VGQAETHGGTPAVEVARGMSAGAVDGRSRWVRLDEYTRRSGRYDRCRFCGRAQDEDCVPKDCLLCGSRLCHETGPSCSVCLKGWMPGWWRGVEGDLCGYKDCDQPGVADAPRVHRVCATHVEDVRLRWRGRSLGLLEYVAECLAHRDSGAGWERWRFVIVSGENPGGQHTLVLGTELAAALGTAGVTGS
jgi:hypothetical protein